MLKLPNGHKSWEGFIEKSKKKGRFHERNSIFQPKTGDYVVFGKNSCGTIIKSANGAGDMLVDINCIAKRVSRYSDLVEGYISRG